MKQRDEDLYNELYCLVKQQIDRGKTITEVREFLLTKNDDLVLITVVIKEARKERDLILQKQGLRLIFAGCAMGLSGFLITLINFNTTRSIDLAMYGLTSIGISLVFWGLFKLIG